jgi:hypothetical protein
MTTIECAEDTVSLPLSEVLVWWKRSFHRMNSNEIGDGMQVLYHCDRPYMLPHMHQDRVIQGASIYKEFDEEV